MRFIKATTFFATGLGATVLIVTHDRAVAESCPRTISLRDGRVVGDEQR